MERVEGLGIAVSQVRYAMPLCGRQELPARGLAWESGRYSGAFSMVPLSDALSSAAGAMKAAGARAGRAVVRVLEPANLTHALRRRDDVGEADTELVVHNHHLALRDQRAVDQHIHRLTGQRVELDH